MRREQRSRFGDDALHAGLLSPELRLAAAEEGLDAFLVILRHARQRELVEVHVTGEIVERMRQSIDRQLGHGDR